MKTMNMLPGPVWLPPVIAVALAIRNKIKERRENLNDLVKRKTAK